MRAARDFWPDQKTFAEKSVVLLMGVLIYGPTQGSPDQLRTLKILG